MVADLGMHFDNEHSPHAHILLTTRDLTPNGFGSKNRSWNETQELLRWRRGWAEVTNEHPIDAGLGVRIDHRSYADQSLDLIPGRKVGLAKERQDTPGRGRRRFTTREMLGLERSLLGSADELAQRDHHGVDHRRKTSVLSQHRLSPEQERAVHEVTSRGDLKSLVGVAGSGKSPTLAAMREIWGQGYTVKGAALAGIAAENLEVAAGIHARTLASYELSWNSGRDPLTKNDVLVIDEAAMIGTRQLERVLTAAICVAAFGGLWLLARIP